MELGLFTSVFVTGLALGGAFLGLAWKADNAVGTSSREELSLLLLSAATGALGQSAARWPLHFAGLFDTVFGKTPLSWRCFLRSSLASCAAFLFFSVLFFQLVDISKENFLLAAETSVSWAAFLSFIAILLGLCLLLNLFPDYVSLLQTRFVIAQLKNGPRIVTQVIWMLLDAALTFLVFFSSFIVLSAAVGATPDNRDSFLSYLSWLYGETVEIAFLRSAEAPIEKQFLFVPFWTTFLTSIWLWLSVVAQLATRLAAPLRQSFAVLQQALPIEDRPLRAVGAVTAAIACLVYWAVMVPVVLLRVA